MCILLCAADKTGAKIVEDWICPSFSPTSRRPHDDDPTAGGARTNARGAAAAAGTSSSNQVESDAPAAGDGVESTPLVGAYVGGTLAILLILLVVTAILSYYVAVRS